MHDEVHYVGWSSQPYIEIYCAKIKQLEYVDGPHPRAKEQIYSANGKSYSFEKDKVTCAMCNTLLAYQEGDK